MQPAMLREQLTLTWFVETGDTDEERTRFVEGGFRAEKTFENKWTPDRIEGLRPRHLAGDRGHPGQPRRRRLAGGGRPAGGDAVRRAMSCRRSLALVFTWSLAAALPARPRPTRAWAIPPGATEQQIEAQKLSKVPKQTKFVEAEYPKEAAEKGIEAEVVLLLDINAQGKVDSVGVAEPATPAGHGLRRGGDGGRPAVRVRAGRDGRQADRRAAVSYRYKFKLKPKDADAGARRARAARPARRQPAPRPAAPARAAGGELHRPAARARHPAADAGRAGDGVPRRRTDRPDGLRGHHRRRGPLPVLRSGARRLEGAGRAARLLPLPHHRDHRAERGGRRHLLRRARHLQPVRRHRHRHPPAQGGEPHGAHRQGDRQDPGHRRRSAGGHPELRRRGPGAVRRADHRARLGARGHAGLRRRRRRCRSSITSAACAA